MLTETEMIIKKKKYEKQKSKGNEKCLQLAHPLGMAKGRTSEFQNSSKEASQVETEKEKQNLKTQNI